MTRKPCIIVDTREQAALDFSEYIKDTEWEVKTGTLSFADYSLDGFQDVVAIERKSLPDLVACVGRERERFIKELITLRGYKCKAVVIEADLKTILAGKWKGVILPGQVLGSIASWRVRYGIEFVYCGNPEQCAGEVFRLLRKYREMCEDYIKRLAL